MVCQHPPRPVTRAAPQLFHPAGHARRLTLLHDTTEPGQITGPRLGPALAATDYPIQPPARPGRGPAVLVAVRPEIDRRQRRLIAHEAHRRRRLQQPGNPGVHGVLILDTDAPPDVRKRPGLGVT